MGQAVEGEEVAASGLPSSYVAKSLRLQPVPVVMGIGEGKLHQSNRHNIMMR